jgi:hypothetical protein
VSLSDEISLVAGVNEIEQRLQKFLLIVGSLKKGAKSVNQQILVITSPHIFKTDFFWIC